MVRLSESNYSTDKLHRPDKCKSEADEELGVSSCWFDPGSVVTAFPKSGTISVANDDKAPRVSTEKEIFLL